MLGFRQMNRERRLFPLIIGFQVIPPSCTAIQFHVEAPKDFSYNKPHLRIRKTM